MHAGGEAERAEIGETELRIAELARPQVVQDGLFLVGLDIAADKIMGVNVFSPGGLQSAEKLEDRSFSGAVVDRLERRMAWSRGYRGHLGNARLGLPLSPPSRHGGAAGFSQIASPPDEGACRRHLPSSAAAARGRRHAPPTDGPTPCGIFAREASQAGAASR